MRTFKWDFGKLFFISKLGRRIKGQSKNSARKLKAIIIWQGKNNINTTRNLLKIAPLFAPQM